MIDPDQTYGDDAQAAEYVLHLLNDAERHAFEARLATDRDLQRLVYQWEARFAPLAEDVREVTPPASVRKRLLHSVDGHLTARRTPSYWGWLAGGLVAAGIVVFVLFADNFGTAPDLTPEFQAELASEDGSVILVAGVIPATHEIVIERLAGTAPEGNVHELWLIPEGADAPVSLGVLDNEGETRIRVADDIAPSVRTGTIALSIEPPGGSTTGAPTGPVIAAAQFTDI